MGFLWRPTSGLECDNGLQWIRKLHADKAVGMSANFLSHCESSRTVQNSQRVTLQVERL
jgi:hypothetical protein